jgi:hypothetical protein
VGKLRRKQSSDRILEESWTSFGRAIREALKLPQTQGLNKLLIDFLFQNNAVFKRT